MQTIILAVEKMGDVKWPVSPFYITGVVAVGFIAMQLLDVVMPDRKVRRESRRR